MASMLRKGMSWLGLGPEEHFDDYYEDEYYDDEEYADDEYADYDEEPAPARASRPRPAPQAVSDDWADNPEASGITVLPSAAGATTGMVARQTGVAVDTSRGVVRPLPAVGNTRPRVVTPTEFNDAPEVGDWFRKGRPVVLNLQGLERDLARRLLDFTSGVTYALTGRVEKLASHVYLLIPADVEVPEADRRRIKEGDLSNDDQ
jgi:cell division inhibitor SepF